MAETIMDHLGVEVDEASRASFDAIQRKQQEKLAAIRKANSIGQEKYSFDVNVDNTFAVLQHQFIVTHPDKSHPILATYGAGPFVIVAMHNTETKTTALAHFDANTTVTDSLNKMYRRVQPESGDAAYVEVHLAGGNMGSLELQYDILQKIGGFGVTIKSSQLGCYDYSSVSSLAIDSRTGHITTEFDAKEIAHPKNSDDYLKTVEARAMTQAFPLDMVKIPSS